MQRILIDKPGGYEALRLVTEPDPAPGPGEVVIACEACGVNYADAWHTQLTVIGWSAILMGGVLAAAPRLRAYVTSRAACPLPTASD